MVIPNINIGTEKCCFFVPMSILLIRNLQKYPLLFYAVEEALECAKNDYYSAGILVFSQLLNQLNHPTPDSRHEIAHEILKKRPTKVNYETVKQKFKKAALEIAVKESKKYATSTAYKVKVLNQWYDLKQQLYGRNFQKSANTG